MFGEESRMENQPRRLSLQIEAKIGSENVAGSGPSAKLLQQQSNSVVAKSSIYQKKFSTQKERSKKAEQQ